MNTRQKDILALLERQGEITIKYLAEYFGVTEMTIHRDLDFLEEGKYLFKKRGAAVYVSAPDRTTHFYAEEKRRIGRLAASLIEPRQSVLFDNSTTAMEAAAFFDGVPGLTFYTTNLETAAILSKVQGAVLYCSGGYYFNDSKGFIGSQAEAFVEKVHADVCLIGASGISLTAGLTGPYSMHTTLEQKIIRASKKRILVADHSKFGKIALEEIAPLDEIDCIVTDSGIREEDLISYGSKVKIMIA